MPISGAHAIYGDLLRRAAWPDDALQPRRNLEMRIGEQRPITGQLSTLKHGGATVATFVLLDNARLPSSVTLYQRYLDLTLEGRAGLRAAAVLAPAPFVFIASPFECFLYEADSEELLLAAGSPEEAAERVFARFTPEALSGGELERLPRRSPRQWGADLTSWLHIWSARLGRATKTQPDALQSLQFHWLLAWKEALTRRPHKAPDSLNIVVEGVGDPAAATIESPAPALFDERHLAAVSRHFPFGIFRAFEAREAAFWHDHDAVTTLSEFLSEARLLSRAKFRSENLICAFSDERTESHSWRAAVMEEPAIARRLTRDDLTIYDPITVRVAESGFGWLLRLYEEIVRFWIEDNLKRKERAQREGGLALQLDFLAPPPAGLHSRGYLDDILLFTLTHALRVKTQSADQRQLAALLIAVKTLELCETYSLPLGKFDQIDRIFEAQ